MSIRPSIALAAILVSILAFALSGCGAPPPASRRGPQSRAGRRAVQSNSQRRRDLVVNRAVDIQAVYEENEIRGDRDFKDRVGAIRGVIRDIGTDILGTPYVAFEGPSDSFFCVQCMFAKEDESKLASLNPGDTVTIAGTCSGKFGNVLIEDCWFYSPPSVSAASIESASPGNFRVWESEGYALLAEFVKLEDGLVSLRDVKGAIVTWNLDALSEEDQKYVHQGASVANKTRPADAETETEQRLEAINVEPKATLHTWTDETGEYKVEAEFLSYTAGMVKLRKKEGQIVKLPIERLSEADQKRIRKRGRR